MQIKTLLFKKILIITVFFLFTIYFSMVIGTFSIMNKMRNIFLGAVSETKNELVNRYNNVDRLRSNGYEITKINLTLIRLFTLHKFVSRGFIQVLYSIEIYGSDNILLYASWNVPARWEIEKKQGQWEIVNIKEKP